MLNIYTPLFAFYGCRAALCSAKGLHGFYLVIAMLLYTQSAISQTVPAIEWDRTFGGIKQEEMYSIIQTTDGGYLLGGDSDSPPSGSKTQGSQGINDYWVVKTNATGAKVWDKRFGGNSREELFSLQQTPDGGYLLGGWSMSVVSGDQTQTSRGNSDYWIVKIDADGNKLWDQRYGGPGDDELRAMTGTSDGGYFFVGESSSGIGGEKTQPNHGEFDIWVVKTDVNGVLEWEASYGGSLDDRVNAVQQTADGGFIIGAWTISPVGFDVSQAGRGSSDMWLIRTDANGLKLWDGRYGGNDNEYLYGLDQTQDGGFILGGYTRSNVNGEVTIPGQGGFDFWIVKTNSAGTKLWDKRYGGQLDEKGKSITETIDGGFIMGGWSESNSGGDKTESTKGASDYWLVKMDALGNKQWDKDLGAVNEERLHDVLQTSDGGFIVAGHSFSGSNGDKTQSNSGINDYWVVKLASTVPTQQFFADKDDDGFGDPATDTLAVAAPDGFVANSTDCDDNYSAINPVAPEICNGGIDDNCNGFADDGDTTATGLIAYYVDNDLDLFGNGLAALACLQPAGSAVTNDDCDDNNAAVNPVAPEICNGGIDDNCNGIADDGDTTTTGLTAYYVDNDLDLSGNGLAALACIQPAGSAVTNDDCDDNNAAVNPAITEICNGGIDDNCNGLADDGDTTTAGQGKYFIDSDNDNFGSNDTIFACIQPAGTVLKGGDCNDNELAIHPQAKELCNEGIDDNCNGLADDGDSTTIGRGSFYIDNDSDHYGSGAAIKACIQPEGTAVENDDCNNNNAGIYPGAVEICNGGIDDDCNGLADDGDTTTTGFIAYYTDNDLDLSGNGLAAFACLQPAGSAVTNDDCDDNNAAINPATPEICNGGIDDNCNGLADDGDSTVTGQGNYFADSDGDTYGAGIPVVACLQPAGTVVSGDDCNDENAAIHPGANDYCNGVDDNCNLITDEDQLEVPVISPEGDIAACSGTEVLLTTTFDPLLSYQWYKGNTPQNGATSNVYSTTKAGSFKVKISTVAGCEATSLYTKIDRLAKPDAQLQVLGNLDICETGTVDLLANDGAGLQYQWKKGSSLISGATDILYTATSKGTYRVIVTNESGCSKTSGTAKVISSCKSGNLLTDAFISDLLVYPNPAQQYLMLELNLQDENLATASVQLLDVLGRTVQEVNIPVSGNMLQYQFMLDPSIFGGNYVIRVAAGNYMVVKHIVIQR